MPLYTREEAYAIVLLQHGPMPYPAEPDYDSWYGGGFGTDMLSRETQAAHGANCVYKCKVEVTLRKLGHGGDAGAEAFMRNQRELFKKR